LALFPVGPLLLLLLLLLLVVLVREEMFVAVEVPQPAAPEAVGSAAVDVRTADGQRGGGGVDLGVAAERPHDPACRATAVAAATFPGRQQLTHSYQSWSLFQVGTCDQLPIHRVQ